MQLQRLLQINMATLAAMGALLLGMGERSIWPPLTVALAAALSVWLTDITGWFRLNRFWGNLSMLLAGAISLRDLLLHGSAVEALGLARFVIFLQIVLLFHKKDERTFWLLVMLSLLEVVLATLFSQGVWFGVLLVQYMMLGFSAMTLLLLHRQWERHRPADVPAPRPSAPPGRVPRWPLSGQQADFAGAPGGSGLSAIGRDLFVRLGRMGFDTLALTLLLFFAVPRMGQVAWRSPIAEPETTTGFSDRVMLGGSGPVNESSEEVMTVKFYDYYNKIQLKNCGEIYLQGVLLSTYDRGEWSMQVNSPNVDTLRRRRLPKTDLVRQEITIEGLDSDELFFVAPYVALESNEDIKEDTNWRRLKRDRWFHKRKFSYSLGTTAIVGETQMPLIPALPEDRSHSQNHWLDMPRKELLPNLTEMARRWIAESGLPEEDRVGRASYLERQFTVSGRFQYSLASPERDEKIDPIEDFLTRQPRGNCNYFATALTLMLRSQGIPARIVVGYKCDAWNDLFNCYQVRQLHAHTWVQAYLLPGQLPEQFLHGQDYWRWQWNGGWLQLDPTPGNTALPNEATDWFAGVRHAQEWLNFVWSNYVVDLDYRMQRDAIYRPIARAVQDLIEQGTDPDWWREMSSAVADEMNVRRFSGASDWLVAATIATIGALMLTGVGWLLWRAFRRLGFRWLGNRVRFGRRRREKVEFYRRFETLLARSGLVRRPAQTQQEFASTAAAHLVAITGQSRLAPLPGVIAAAFYHVRFGRQPLDSHQADAVENALAAMTAAPRITP